MMSNRQYQAALEGYKTALVSNPQLTLRAYARKNNIGVSGFCHYLNDRLHLSVKQIKAEVLGISHELPSKSSPFVEVISETPVQEDKTIPIEIVFPSGIKMTVNDGSLTVLNALIDKFNTTV